MLDCQTCSISDVCKISDSLKQALLYADVSLANCKIKSALNGSVSVPATQPMASVNPVPMVPAQPRVYRDLRAESDAKKQEDEAKPMIKVSVSPDLNPKGPAPRLELFPCPSCATKTPMDDMIPCHGEDCENITCSECGTEHQGKRYCKECYDKL